MTATRAKVWNRRNSAGIEAHHQPSLAPLEQLLHHTPHGVGHFHPIVVGEAPQAFDLVLEHDGALGLQGNGRQADPPDTHGRRHEQGQSFGLTKPHEAWYGPEAPIDHVRGIHGGSSAFLG